MNTGHPHLVRRSLLVASLALGLYDQGQAKECYYNVGVVLVSAQGEQFLLTPPPSSTTYGATWDFGAIHLSAGAYVRVICSRVGDSMGDCSAYCQRDGVHLTPSSAWMGTQFFDCSIPGSYSGGATGDPFWGPTIYQFTIAEVSSTPVLQELRLGCVLKGTVASAQGNTMSRNLFSVPCAEPYTALGYLPSSNGSETVDGCAVLFDQTQVVDWVHVDLLSAEPPYDPVVSLNGLLHADHWITSTDGYSPLTFTVPPGNYRIRIAHRNHLASITDHGVPFTGAPISASFKQYVGAGMMYSFIAPPSCGGQSPSMLTLGNANGNGTVSYVGQGNDRDPILVRIGGNVPTNVVSGYYLEDVNMDGVVRYVGANNDRDPILQMIGGSTPTNVVVGQTP